MKQKEFFDLAAEMRKDCGDWENSKGLSDKARNELIAKVEAMDRMKQIEKQRKQHRICPKKRYILVLAAALVLLMGTGVVGDRAWIADSTDLERETEVTTKVNTDEKDSILLEEEVIYQEIAEKLGIAAIRLGYMPEGMVLDSYTVMENTGWALVNYLYGEHLISIKMVKRSGEISGNLQWDGQSRIIEGVQNQNGYLGSILAYCSDEDHNNYIANIEYGNGFYNIFGVFEDENEFVEILNGIYFKNL